MQRGHALAVVLAALSSLLLLPAGPLLALFGQPTDVVPVAAGYAHALIPGMLPFFVFVVLRQSLQALRRTGALVVAIVGANLMNVVFNWALIFGHLGSPALGAVGAGIATSLSRWAMTLGLIAAAWVPLRPLVVPVRPGILDRRALLHLLRIGVPIGIHHLAEFGAFGVTALLMGTLGTVQMAAHQIALNLASLTFRVPLGVGTAAAVLVGPAKIAGSRWRLSLARRLRAPP